jgi:N-terminal half of MaoC dehydratase
VPLADLIGIESEPFELIVEHGKVREFARATRAEHSVYRDDPVPPIPPTFMMTAAHWAPHEQALLERIPGEPRRRLHGEQEFTFPGPPPRAGARLRGQTRLEAAYEREGGRGGRLRFYVLATEYRDAAGDTVAISRTTVIETERPPESA